MPGSYQKIDFAEARTHSRELISWFTPRVAAASFSSALIPNVEKLFVCCRRYGAACLPGCAVQRRSHFLFGLRKVHQRDLKGDARLPLIEIGNNLGHDRSVFAVSSSGNVDLSHRLEVHSVFARACHVLPPENV